MNYTRAHRALSGTGLPRTVVARPVATAARMLYTLWRPTSGELICRSPTGVRSSTWAEMAVRPSITMGGRMHSPCRAAGVKVVHVPAAHQPPCWPRARRVLNVCRTARQHQDYARVRSSSQQRRCRAVRLAHALPRQCCYASCRRPTCVYTIFSSACLSRSPAFSLPSLYPAAAAAP